MFVWGEKGVGPGVMSQDCSEWGPKCWNKVGEGKG